MQREFHYHNYDVNIVQSYYNLKELIDSGNRQVSPKYSHINYLQHHLSIVKLVIERKGENVQAALDQRLPVILPSDDYSYFIFFCMELVTRQRFKLPHFLSYQMERHYKGEAVFLEIMKNGVIDWLLNNDPFQDETLLEYINAWIEKQELNKRWGSK